MQYTPTIGPEYPPGSVIAITEFPNDHGTAIGAEFTATATSEEPGTQYYVQIYHYRKNEREYIATMPLYSYQEKHISVFKIRKESLPLKVQYCISQHGQDDGPYPATWDGTFETEL